MYHLVIYFLKYTNIHIRLYKCTNVLIYIQVPLNVVAQRYSVELVSWCLLDNGKILVYSYSQNFDDLHPDFDVEGLVRAKIYFNSLLVEPRGNDGSLITYVTKVYIYMHYIYVCIQLYA